MTLGIYSVVGYLDPKGKGASGLLYNLEAITMD